MRITLIICTTVILCACLGVVGWAYIHNVNQPSFYYIMSTVGLIIGQVFTIARTGKIKDKVDTIEENTNGHLTTRVENAVTTAVEKVLNDDSSR